jgi:nucleoside-diphosphate-sugar epimerase
MITGAYGFFGSNLVRYLDGSAHDLVLVDRQPNLFDEKNHRVWHRNHLVYHHDFSTTLPLEKTLGQVDAVIHLANRARIEPSWRDYQNYYDTNIAGSQRLFEQCQRAGVKRFFYFSSSSVYGNNGTLRQKETDPLCPTNPYAVSKVAAELMLTAQAALGDTELIIVRPFTMYGDFMDHSEYGLVIAKFISAWERDEPLLLDGGGSQRRDFLHASDALRAFQLIMEHGRGGDIYNLGSGTSVSVRELADIISDKQVIVPKRRGHVEVTHADIIKLKMLGFAPRVRVTEWLQETMEELKINAVIQ